MAHVINANRQSRYRGLVWIVWNDEVNTPGPRSQLDLWRVCNPIFCLGNGRICIDNAKDMLVRMMKASTVRHLYGSVVLSKQRLPGHLSNQGQD